MARGADSLYTALGLSSFEVDADDTGSENNECAMLLLLLLLLLGAECRFLDAEMEAD